MKFEAAWKRKDRSEKKGSQKKACGVARLQGSAQKGLLWGHTAWV